MKPIINMKMAKILRAIHEEGGGLTPNKIANKTGFSQFIVRKYLRVAMEKEILITDKKIEINKKKTRGKPIRYSIDYE